MRQALVVLRVLLFAAAVLVAVPAHAQFRAEHAPATDPASLRIRQANVRDEHMVHFAERLNRWVNLPRPVTLRMMECPTSDVRWVPAEQVVEVCYRMAIRVFSLMGPADSTARVAGPAIEFLLFHGVAHAIVDELDLPAPAGEEQAVDELAALLLIHTGPRFGSLLVEGVTTLQRVDPRWAEWEFAAAHGRTPERCQTIACIAYGANPQVFGVYREMGLVPAARAGSCGAAYRRVAAGALGRRLERYM